MNSQQVQDIRLMYEAVYNEELREKTETVKSSGGMGGAVTVDKQYPATLGGKKGVKSTDSQGTEYFMPYQSQGGLSKPNILPDLNKAQYKNTYTNRYQNIPSNQGAANPQSHLSRTGVPRVNARTAAYGIPEQVDLFDYLLEYLVAEGYADTNQDALVIMANMSKEDLDEATRFFYKLQARGKGGSKTAQAQLRPDADLERQKNRKMRQQQTRQRQEREPEEDERDHGSMSAAERNPSMR